MKKFFTLTTIITLLYTTSLCGQEVNYSVLSISPELLENSNAVVRNNTVNITIESINKMVVEKTIAVTVLNKLGNVDAKMGEGYDNDTRIIDLSALVFDKFGKQIKKIKERDFLDVSAVDGGTLYSDSRVKYANYTPISYPYTIVFKSKYKTSTTGFIPSWYPVNGHLVSVQKSTYTINNPKAIPWRYKKTHFDGFDISSLETNTQIKYILKNQPAYKYERNAVSYRDFLPKAMVTLNNFQLKGVVGVNSNWKDFGKWMYDELLKGRDQLEEATINKIKNLVKGEEDPIERAKIVYKYMQDKTRYISVQVGIGGWEPIAANKVDAVGYGDCKGLTNYTKALLDVAGVTSYYTVVYADEKRDIDKDFSSIQGNHVILNLPNKNGEDIWLECTSQIAPFGFLGSFTDDRNVLVVTPEGGIIKHTTSYEDENNLQVLKGKIQLLEDGNLTATLNRTSKGLQYDDKYYYDTKNKEELIKMYKSDVWSYNNNLEVLEVSLKNDKDKIAFTENLKLSLHKYASVNENEYLFRVNVFNKERFVPKRYRKRKMPLKISTGYKDVDEYEFKLPEGYVLGVLPAEKIITSKFGSYKVVFKKIDNSTFKYHKTIVIKEGVYPKEDYKAYRSFRRSIAKYENLRIAITKKS